MPPHPLRGAPCALLVDDDRAVLASLAAYAEIAGYEGVCAADGLQALGMLRGGLRPAVIVTDVEMPNLDGLALVRNVRESDVLGSTRVIFFSGSPRPADGGGGDLWLKKTEAAALIAALRAFAD